MSYHHDEVPMDELSMEDIEAMFTTRPTVPPSPEVEQFQHDVEARLGFRGFSYDEMIAEAGRLPEGVLVGSSKDIRLSRNTGFGIFGPKGGAKTTFSTDFLCHLASGTKWMGHKIAEPLVCGVIQAEGPVRQYMDRMREKKAAWKGKPFAQNLHYFYNPNTGYTRTDLYDAALCTMIQNWITANKIDVVLIDPLGGFGIQGHTSMNAYDFKDRLDVIGKKHTAWVVVHHHKHGGKVEQEHEVRGAWEDIFSTNLHIKRSQGRSSKIRWSKVRYGDYDPDQWYELPWTTDDSFGYQSAIPVTTKNVTPEMLRERLVSTLQKLSVSNAGIGRTKLIESTKGDDGDLRAELKNAIIDGAIIESVDTKLLHWAETDD
jgi:AAA domain